MAGNYAIGGMDNWVNKGMSFNQAFSPQHNPVVLGGSYSPGNQTFSNFQVTQHIIAKHEELLSQQLDAAIADFSGMGRDIENWFSDHIFADVEFRFDRGLQAGIDVKAYGGMIGGHYEHNTEPLLQLNFGYNARFYGEGYAFDNPKYGYGGVSQPIRNGWSGAYVVGGKRSYDSNSKLFKFGYLESENINWGGVNIATTYNRQGKLLESKYYWGFGFDFSAILGISFDINIGYKHNYK
jgi:hypothetical protein